MRLTLCTAEVMLSGTHREMALRSLQRFDSLSVGWPSCCFTPIPAAFVLDAVDHAMQCLSLPQNSTPCFSHIYLPCAVETTHCIACQVVAVDMAVYPPSYGVMIGDSIRETEASRLKTRGSIKTKSSDLVQHSPPEDRHRQGRLVCQPPMSNPLQCLSIKATRTSQCLGIHTPCTTVPSFALHNTTYVPSACM